MTGLAVINKHLDPITPALSDASRFCRMAQQLETSYIGPPDEISPNFLDRAHVIHRRCLPELARAVASKDALLTLLVPCGGGEVTPVQASTMLNYLFKAKGTRRGADAAAKLVSCVDVFSQSSNALGAALGLWAPVSGHPAFRRWRSKL